MSFTSTSAYRTFLFTASFAIFCTPPAAVAQGQQAADEEVEEIIVTGSRIARAGFDTLQPAVNIDADFMDDRGFANVADALNEVPAFGLGVSNSGRQGALQGGQNFVNAFGLGTQRTLTLINGRRVVGQNSPGVGDNGGASPSAGAGLQVDLNIIPTVLIERVETIFIGGAPIYGSDAIAGTVNVILRDDFDGFSMDAQWGTDERGTAENARIRGAWGANVDEGRGNVVLAAEFTSSTGVDSSENSVARRQTAFCENPAAGLNAVGLPIVDPNDGIPDLVLCDDAVNVWQVPNSGLPLVPGAFLTFPDGTGTLRDAQGNPLVFDAGGNLVTFDQANLGTPRGVFFSVGGDGFNNPNVFTLAERVPVASPLDRWNLLGTGQYRVADNMRVFLEGLFSRTETEAIPGDVPQFSTNVFAPGANGNIMVNIADNPYVTPALRSVLIDNGVFDPNLTDDQFFQLSRSNADVFGVESRDKREQNVYRFVVGLEGEFDMLDDAWNWDAAFNFGETTTTSRQPVLNGQRYALALDAVRDPATNEIVCRAQIDPPETFFDNVFQTPLITDITECIPFNPIGVQQITPEQRRYLVQEDFQTTKIRQLSYEANVTGEPFSVPAGPVSVAAGFQYRREEASFNVDRSSQLGLDPSAAIPNVSGEFDTTEFYFEGVLPVVENGVGPGFDVPFLASLQIEGAVRFVDNSRAGDDVTWTAGGRLRPQMPWLEDGLTIRGNFTRSIRSPSVQELFLPRTEIATFAQDPCDPEFLDAGPNPALRRANCEAQVQSLIAAGALPPDFDLADFESLIDNRTEEGTFGGNTQLKNEVADSWTVGFVVAPPAWEGFTASLDWTNISIEDEIAALSATQILSGCYDSPSFPSVDECNQFGRDPEFQVLNPQTGLLNAARRDFEGLVSNITYRFDAAALPGDLPGEVEVLGYYFHNAKVEREVSGGDLEVLTGERGFERNRWQLNLRYMLDSFMFMWQARYIGEFVVDNQAAPERFAPGEGKAPSVNLHNLTLTYQFNDRFGVRAVVNNVFDERDGRVRQASALTGSNTDPFEPLDIIGRRFLFGVTADF